MSKVIKNSAGKFFIENSGFTGTEANATTFDSCSAANDTVSCLKRAGIFDAVVVTKTPASASFAVCYIRKGDINAAGGISNKKLSSGFPETPSSRRFATEDEAVIHGSRFRARRARAGDKPGTAGHVGFYVIKTNDPVNAAVNPKTGMTNSI